MDKRLFTLISDDIFDDFPILIVIFKFVVSLNGDVDKVDKVYKKESACGKDSVQQTYKVAECACKVQNGQTNVYFSLYHIDELVGTGLGAVVENGQKAQQKHLNEGTYEFLSLIGKGVEQGIEPVDHKFDL